MVDLGATVFNLGNGVYRCRSCNMTFHHRDMVGPYPTRHGEPKGLFYGAHSKTLRHDCKKGNDYASRPGETG